MAWYRRGPPRTGRLPLRKRGRDRAFTLTEVLVAILLLAIVIIAVLSVSLTAKRSTVRIDRRVAASWAAAGLLEQLRSYHTADVMLGAGPNGGSWTLPGDACGGCGASCYALEPGAGCVHTANAFLPPELSSAPYNMSMSYTVVDEDGSGAQDFFRPRISVQVDWTEPL